MGFFTSMDISASGMTAQRFRMDVISQNLANVNSTNPDGTAYRRKVAVLEAEETPKFVVPVGGFLNEVRRGRNVGGKVKVAGVVEDNAPVQKIYDPTNPAADKEGFVEVSNVNTITEMTNMIAASRAYEANATAIDTAKKMAMEALNIGKS